MKHQKLALYLTAEKYRLNKNYRRAISIYRELLALDPDDLGVMLKLGRLFEQEEMTDEAAAMFGLMSRHQLRAGQKDEALKSIQKALSLKPQDHDFLEIMHSINPETIALPTESHDPEIILLNQPVVRLDSPLFRELKESEADLIIDKITPLKMLQGTVIFEEGDQSDSLYIIKEGSFELRTSVSFNEKQQQDTVFSILKVGQFFGEFAFLTGSPRVATVRALEDSVVYQLTRTDLEAIVKQFPNVEERLFLFYKSRALDLVLAKSPLFHRLSVQERREVLEKFILKKGKTGDLVVKEGQRDDTLFLIKKGELQVETTDHQGRKIFLSTLSKHQFFGEISFLTHVPRTADVIAVTDYELLMIGKEDLEQIVVRHPDIKQVLIDFQQSRAMATVKKLTSPH